MMYKNKLIVVDLDGTLVAGNTLHLYFKCWIRQMIKSGRQWCLVAPLFILLSRRLHFISHISMKYKMLSCISTDKDLKEQFKKLILNHTNTAVLNMVKHFQSQGCKILIATAAPDLYMMDVKASIPELEGTDVISSSYLSADGNLLAYEDIIENRGEVKALHVNQYCTDNNLKLAAIITDHSDDMPLVNLAKKSNAVIYLTGPKPPRCDGVIYI